jgi:hypothetical protein
MLGAPGKIASRYSRGRTIVFRRVERRNGILFKRNPGGGCASAGTPKARRFRSWPHFSLDIKFAISDKRKPPGRSIIIPTFVNHKRI